MDYKQKFAGCGGPTVTTSCLHVKYWSLQVAEGRVPHPAMRTAHNSVSIVALVAKYWSLQDAGCGGPCCPASGAVTIIVSIVVAKYWSLQDAGCGEPCPYILHHIIRLQQCSVWNRLKLYLSASTRSNSWTWWKTITFLLHALGNALQILTTPINGLDSVQLSFKIWRRSQHYQISLEVYIAHKLCALESSSVQITPCSCDTITVY